MPVFNSETKQNPNLFVDDQVYAQPPTEPDRPMSVILDTASVFKDLQYSGDIVVGIEGFPDSVTYYSQLMANDDLVGNAGDVIDPTIRQLKRINNFEIRLTQALTPTVDDANNTSTVIGEANLYPTVTPKIGDILVKSVRSDRGIWGVFQVTNVERKSMFSESVWGITFSQIRYSDSNRDKESDRFVLYEFDFHVENLEIGANPLVLTSSSNKSQSVIKLRDELINRFYNTFYNKEIGTFLVPIQGFGNVYDPFLVKFWNSIVSMKYGFLAKPMEYPINNSFDRINFLTIFDIYLTQSVNLLNSVVREVVMLSVEYFTADYLKATLLGSKIDYVIYTHTNLPSIMPSLFPKVDLVPPEEQIQFVDANGKPVVWVTNTPNINLSSNPSKDDILNSLRDTGVAQWDNLNIPVTTPGPTLPNDTYPVKGNDINYPTSVPYRDNYIFSNDFYTNGTNQSLLERLIVSAMNRETIATKDVILALEMLKLETNIIDQFYKLPFIISLLQVSR